MIYLELSSRLYSLRTHVLRKRVFSSIIYPHSNDRNNSVGMNDGTRNYNFVKSQKRIIRKCLAIYAMYLYYTGFRFDIKTIVIASDVIDINISPCIIVREATRINCFGRIHCMTVGNHMHLRYKTVAVLIFLCDNVKL